MAPLLALTAGSHIAIQTLWVGPWLRDVAGFDRGGAAYGLFIMASAFFVGILFTGAVADWFARRGVSLLHVMMGFIALFLASQALLFMDIRALDLVLWCIFSMTGQVAILAYPWLARYFGPRLSGRATTAMNLLMFLAAFAVQYAIGAIIDTYLPPAPGDTTLPPTGLRSALSSQCNLRPCSGTRRTRGTCARRSTCSAARLICM